MVNTRSGKCSPEPLLPGIGIGIGIGIPRRRRRSEKHVKPQVPPPQPQIGYSDEAPLEISCCSETKPIVDPLLRLRPPPAPPKRSPGEELPPDLLEKSLDLVLRVQSFLVSQLINTTDLNKMIDLANNAFSTLDWCRTNYASFHADVCDFIRCRRDRLAAEEERDGCVYSYIITQHEELVNRLNDAEDALWIADCKLERANENLQPLKKQIGETRELLMELEGDMADREVEIGDLENERDRCNKAFVNAGSEARRVEPLREEAEAALKEIDRRVEAAIEGDERMGDVLRSRIRF